MTVPAYVDIERLCSELCIQPSRVLDQMRTKLLPLPILIDPDHARWKWETVIKYQNCPERVYFIKCGAFIKIGYTANIKARFRNLQATNPLDLEILHTIRGGKHIEERLHHRFYKLHHRDEWFRAEKPLLDYIEGLKEEA